MLVMFSALIYATRVMVYIFKIHHNNS